MPLWRDLGHVYVADGASPWLASHASYPTPLALPDGRLRVFFSPRDGEGRSSVFSLDIALNGDRFERLGPPSGPWLTPGARGAFDDAGASVSCVRQRADGGLECWYLGWTLGVSVPFRTAIGLAVSAPGETGFTRVSQAPVLDRAAEDPFVLGYPWVMSVADELWAWYGTHLAWGEGRLEMTHAIRRAARGADGAWRRDAVPALMPAGGDEFALSRPTVMRGRAAWEMWYCRRLGDYRLGYARSVDGVAWRRADADLTWVGGPDGPRAYPSVFDHAGRRYMLHNTAGYGRSGFRLALLEVP